MQLLKMANRIVPRVSRCIVGIGRGVGVLKIVGPLDRWGYKITYCVDRGDHRIMAMFYLYICVIPNIKRGESISTALVAKDAESLNIIVCKGAYSFRQRLLE